MNKLAKLIEGLEKEDLLKIRRDLVSGNIDNLITSKLSEKTNISEKNCPVCGGEIQKDAFMLEFGASYLRKRAYFDGVDCIEYFLNTKIKQKPSEED